MTDRNRWSGERGPSRQLPVIPASVPTHDNTMFSWLDRCGRLYETMAINGQRPSVRAVALDFGSFIHEGLAEWYRTIDPLLVSKKLDSLPYEDPIDDHRTRGRAINTLAEYINHYGADTERFGRILLTETATEVEDANGFRYGGKLDLVVLHHNEPWVVDHKTTSVGGDVWWDEWRLSPQMIGYVWLASQLVGAQIRGVIVNRIIVGKNVRSPSETFNWRPFLIRPELIEEWYASRIKSYKRVAQLKTDGYYPPNFAGCVGRYGKCPQFNVCVLPQESRDRALSQDFHLEPWDWRKTDGE